ncbi:hypothetical protein SDC9_190245 [bioreactor metagenome]|uniref:Uncharacterized protein n=1 Tax=bioreactor metagenome TaxID=1076179 RepID=A0A645HUI5_9ZZZZ
MVHTCQRFDNRSYLLFQIAFGNIDGRKFPPLGTFLSLRRVQIVLAFQIFSNGFTPLMFLEAVDFLSLTIHPERYDMQVFPPNIFMFENKIRLIAVAQFFHVFTPNVRQLVVR